MVATDIGMLSDALLEEEETAGLADARDQLRDRDGQHGSESDSDPTTAATVRWPQVIEACRPGLLSSEDRDVIVGLAGAALGCAQAALAKVQEHAALWRHSWHRNAVNGTHEEHPGDVGSSSLLRLARDRPSEALVIRPAAGASHAAAALGSASPNGHKGEEAEDLASGEATITTDVSSESRLAAVLAARVALQTASSAAVRAAAAAAPDLAMAAVAVAGSACEAAWLSPHDFSPPLLQGTDAVGSSSSSSLMDWQPMWHLGVVGARLLAESNRAVAASHGLAELGCAPRLEPSAEGAGRVFGEATAVGRAATIDGVGDGSSVPFAGGLVAEDGEELDADGVEENDEEEDDLLGPGWEDGGEEAGRILAAVTSRDAVEKAVGAAREDGEGAGARAWEDGGSPGGGMVGVPRFGLFPGSGTGGGPSPRLSASQAETCARVAAFSVAALAAAGAHRHAASLCAFLLGSSPSSALGSGAWQPMPGGGPWSGAGARNVQEGFALVMRHASSAEQAAGGTDRDAERSAGLGPSRARDAASLHRTAEQEAGLAQGTLQQRGSSAAAKAAVEALAVALVHGRSSAEILAQRAERRLAARFR